MKKLLLTLGILVLFALSASAQIPTPFSFYAGGALSVPSSPEGFSDGWKTGYHGMAGVGYKMSPKFQLVGKLEYHNFSADVSNYPDLDGGNAKIMMYGVDGRFSLGLPMTPIKPFFFGGGGIAHVEWDEFTGTNLITSTLNSYLPEAENKFYYNAGAGVEFAFGPTMNFFVQGRYVSVATEGEKMSYIPITLGLKFF